MDQQLYPSISCPSCRQGLLLAALNNLAFLRQAYCPYCGVAVRLALRPLVLMILGIVSFSVGYSYLGAEVKLLEADLPFPPEMLLIGIGILALLLGMIFTRFIKIESSVNKSQTAQRSVYPYIR